MLTRKQSEINQWIPLEDVVDLTYDRDEELVDGPKEIISIGVGVSSKLIPEVTPATTVSSPTQLSSSDLRPLIKQMTTELRESGGSRVHETKRTKNKTRGRNRKVKPRASRKRRKDTTPMEVTLHGKSDEFVGSEFDVQSDDMGEEDSSPEGVIHKRRKVKEKEIVLPERVPTGVFEEVATGPVLSIGSTSLPGLTEAGVPSVSVSPTGPSSQPAIQNTVSTMASENTPGEVATLISPPKPSKEINRGVTMMNLNKDGQTMEVVVASGRKRAPKEIEYLYSVQSHELEEKEKRRLLREEHMKRIEEKRYQAMLAQVAKAEKKKKKEKKGKKERKEKTKKGRKMEKKKKPVNDQEKEIVQPTEPLIPLSSQPEPHSFILSTPQDVKSNSDVSLPRMGSSTSSHFPTKLPTVQPSVPEFSDLPEDGFTNSFAQITKETHTMNTEQPIFTLSQPERSESIQVSYGAGPAIVHTPSPSHSHSPSNHH